MDVVVRIFSMQHYIFLLIYYIVGIISFFDKFMVTQVVDLTGGQGGMELKCIFVL